MYMAEGETRPRVLVVEDHTLMVDALVTRLERANMEVAAAAKTADQCLALYSQLQPDLVLCDIGLGTDFSGVDLTKQLLERHPEAKVLMYSGYTDPDLVQSAMAAGAVGYIRKTSSFGELQGCLEAAAAGETGVFDRWTSREMIDNLRRGPAVVESKLASLTPREREIVELMKAGRTSDKELATRLGISHWTARSHVAALREKLGVGSRAEVIAMAMSEPGERRYL